MNEESAALHSMMIIIIMIIALTQIYLYIYSEL